LRVVEVDIRVCAESLKESEKLSSGGIVPLGTQWSGPWKDLSRKRFEAEEILQEGESMVKVRGEESREIPLTIRSQGSCAEVKLSA